MTTTRPDVEVPVTWNAVVFTGAPVFATACCNALVNEPELTESVRAVDNLLNNTLAATDGLVSPVLGV